MSDPTAMIEALDPAKPVLVNGTWRGGSGTRFTVLDPATGRPLADLAGAGPEDVDDVVASAAAAGAGWERTAPRARSEVLMRTFELMHRDLGPLSETISAENGKSLPDARAEVAYAAEFFRWFAEEAVRGDGHFGVSPAGGTRTVVTSRPVGVAALITPWNFPAAMATRKIAPALAAGCTVVLKPAAETPLTAMAIARLLCEAGLPDGVVNLVPTLDAPGVVSRLMQAASVRKISFTGSTNVGRLLLGQAAQRVLNSSMELGGNAPFVVTAGADVPAAVDGAMLAKFRGGGQACTAANRLYVHDRVADHFTSLFAARVEALAVGPASGPSCDVGPLISKGAVERVEAVVADALGRGAHVAATAAPRSWCDPAGYFVPAQVLVDVAADALAVTEELFAPVAPIVRWSDDDELLGAVNGTELGLAAYVYEADVGRALRLAEQIQSGMVGINRGLISDPAAPFGGMKQSGLGREGAHEGLAEYTETQYLSVDWPEH